MIIIVQSGKAISAEDLEKVRGIFRESQCPNESLSKTFEDFQWFNGKVIQLTEGENFVEYIRVRNEEWGMGNEDSTR